MPMIGCKGFEINVGMLTETSNESALSLSLSLSLSLRTRMEKQILPQIFKGILFINVLIGK